MQSLNSGQQRRRSKSIDQPFDEALNMILNHYIDPVEYVSPFGDNHSGDDFSRTARPNTIASKSTVTKDIRTDAVDTRRETDGGCTGEKCHSCTAPMETSETNCSNHLSSQIMFNHPSSKPPPRKIQQKGHSLENPSHFYNFSLLHPSMENQTFHLLPPSAVTSQECVHQRHCASRHSPTQMNMCDDELSMFKIPTIPKPIQDSGHGESSLFGLPPIPQSSQNFATLPKAGEEYSLPPLDLLEGDPERISIRAQTTADHVDASEPFIRSAIQPHPTAFYSPKKEPDHTLRNKITTNGYPVHVTSTHKKRCHEHSSRPSFSVSYCQNGIESKVENNSRKLMKNQVCVQEATIKSKSEGPQSSRNSKGKSPKQIISLVQAQRQVTDKETKSRFESSNMNGIINRIVSIISEYLNVANKQAKYCNEERPKFLVSDQLSNQGNVYFNNDALEIHTKEEIDPSCNLKKLEKCMQATFIGMLSQSAELSRSVPEEKEISLKECNDVWLQDSDAMASEPNIVNGSDASYYKRQESIDFEAGMMEMEKREEDVCTMASHWWDIFYSIPEPMTDLMKYPYHKDVIDVLPVSDTTCLLGSGGMPCQNDSLKRAIPNELNAIGDDAIRFTLYSHQLVCDGGIDASLSSNEGEALLEKLNSTKRSYDNDTFTSLAIPENTMMPVNIASPTELSSAELFVGKDSLDVEHENCVLGSNERCLLRLQKKSTPPSVSRVTHHVHDVSQNALLIGVLQKQGNIHDETNELAPIEAGKSLQQHLSEKQEQKPTLNMEEARLWAFQILRPTRGTKRISNGPKKTFVPKQPEVDYVLNPNVDQIHKDSSLSNIELLTWKDVLAGSDWVTQNDIGIAADSVLISIAQFRPCRLRNDDRTGRYFNVDIGFVGLCCNHCFGLAGYGRFFPKTLSSFMSNLQSTIVRHILDDCNGCPKLLQDTVKEVENLNQISALRSSVHLDSKSLMNFVWEKLRNAKLADIDLFEEEKRRVALQTTIEDMTDSVTWEELLRGCDIVAIDDIALVSKACLSVWGQFEKCMANVTDFDRMRSHNIVYTGYCCRHCKGVPYTDGSRFFPTTVMALQSPEFTVRFKAHLMSDCRACPSKIRTAIVKLHANMQTSEEPRHGSKKKFFGRIWKRLHKLYRPCTVDDCLQSILPHEICEASDLSKSKKKREDQNSIMTDSMSTSLQVILKKQRIFNACSNH